jgi:hypothetical protein
MENIPRSDQEEVEKWQREKKYVIDVGHGRYIVLNFYGKLNA